MLRQQTLSPGMVRRIRHLRGVTRVEQFSWAQASIEDHAVNVAAVDPATYRNFTIGRVATFQPEWNRVAGGEMALRQGFSKQVSKKGFVRLGARSDAPEVHVGAYSPQVPQVDAVVNQSWIKTLGMVPGNALLISKGASDEAMDYAQCIGCGACVASCKNASAALFTAAKVSHLALLPQGQPERLTRVRAMVDTMDAEGFGACSNEGECEATCPKGISIAGIARMNRQYTQAVLSGAGEKKAAASGD